MKFSQKISVGVSLVSIVLIFITILLIYTINRIQTLIREVEALPELQAQLGTLTIQHYEWTDALLESMFLNKEFKKAINPRECDLGKWYYSHKPDARFAEAFAKIEDPHIRFHGTAEKILPLVKNGKLDEALQIYQSETLIHLKQTRDALTNLRTEVKKALTDDLNRLVVDLKNFRNIVFILFFVLLVLLIVFSYFFIIKPLTRSMNSLISVADSVAKGNFSMIKEKNFFEK